MTLSSNCTLSGSGCGSGTVVVDWQAKVIGNPCGQASGAGVMSGYVADCVQGGVVVCSVTVSCCMANKGFE